MKTLDHTVAATSGRQAASTRETPPGTGMTWPTGTATRSAYPPPASSAHTSSPTDQPGDALAELGDAAAALEADRVGGAGRRRVEALPLQGVGAVDRRGDDLDEDLAGAGARGVDLADGQDLGAAGAGGDDCAQGLSPRSVSVEWSTVESSGTSSSTSSGSGASAGRSQLSASCCALAASRSTFSGSRSPAPAAKPSRYGVIGAAVFCTLCAATRARSRIRPFVDLGLDVEHVGELIDPVVKVHGPNLPHRPGARQGSARRGRAGRSTSRCRPPRRRSPAPSRGRAARAAGAAPSRAAPPARGVRRPGGPRRAPRPAAADRRRRPGTPRPGRPRPRAAGATWSGVTRGMSTARTPTSAGRRSRASTPVRRPATGPPRGGSSQTKVTGRPVGTLAGATTTTSSASRNASSASSSSVRPSSSTAALSMPSIRAAVPPARTTPQKPRPQVEVHAGQSRSPQLWIHGRSAAGARAPVGERAGPRGQPCATGRGRHARRRPGGPPGGLRPRLRRGGLGRQRLRRAGRRPLRLRAGTGGGRRGVHRGRRDVRGRRRPRSALQHPRRGRHRLRDVPQDPPLRLLRLPRSPTASPAVRPSRSWSRSRDGRWA